ncbi:MAG: hypothetical protein EXQ94_10370 [Alphaproteobacteria bacterium]|nr:hypothetical protein [Alphaproteobacteria bacterium]
MTNEVGQLLPIAAYTSADWSEREQRDLFSRSWVFAGFTGDLTSPGDYRCVRAGRYSLILLRFRDERLRAFH